MNTQIEIKQKIAILVAKWKDKVPEKNTDKYWRYRADQSLYKMLKGKLKKTTGQQEMV